MDHSSLVDIANAMVQKGKGILAADESTPTCKKRFDSINVESSEENRNKYRNMLFTADGIENYISGVILFDETLRQSTMEGGVPFPDHLTKLGILPGIKVDKGAKQLANDYMKKQLENLDKYDGNIDTLTNRISNVRTWSYVANKKNCVGFSWRVSDCE